MTEFRTIRRVEFQHCDPAGIVFYPRFFEMINSVVEEWFGTELGLSFAAMHTGDRCGVPTAKIEASFPAPSRLGETLEFSLRLSRLGRTSAGLVIEALCGGEVRVVATSVLVFVAGTGMRPAPWPEAQRVAMSRFLVAESEAAE
jgi:4-hydroxybenzoyl-CoA thioesterase